jgi:dolichyl-phosphooligosaccharide-protein glycotransferase
MSELQLSSFDWSRISGLSKKKSVQIIAVCLTVLFLVGLAVFIRAQTFGLPGLDSIAASQIQQNVAQGIRQQILSNQPMLEYQPQILETQVAQKTQEYLRENQQMFLSAIAQYSSSLREQFRDPQNNTYHSAIDPYFFLRHVRNIVERGHLGEYINSQGLPASRLSAAPNEMTFSRQDTLMKLSVFTFFVWSTFDSSVTLEKSTFFIPAIIYAFVTLIAFLIGYRFIGYIGGVATALFIALHPFLYQRTPAGIPDTDGLVILFILLPIYLLIELRRATNTYTRLGLGAGIGLSLALFAYTWSGWYISFFLVVAGFALGIFSDVAKEFLKHKTLHAKHLTSSYGLFWSGLVGLGVFLLCYGLFIQNPINVGAELYNSLFRQQTSLTGAVEQNLWPNVLTTVAELSKPSVDQIIRESGTGSAGTFLFYFSLFGLVLLLYLFFTYAKELPGLSLEVCLVCALFVAGAFYMALSGVRFLLFTSLAISLALGLTFGAIYVLATKKLRIPAFVSGLVCLVAIAFIAQPMYASVNQMANGLLPSMNDQWYDVLTKIQNSTPSDTIISSWWDYGHQFIYFSQKGSTGDGTTQKAPTTIWLGVALATSDPAYFRGISTMLNCHGNAAYDALFNETSNTVTSIRLLEKILRLSYDDAYAYLVSQNITSARTVLSYSHCSTSAPSVWIMSEDMVGKAPVWAHFGTWDYAKAQAYALRNDPTAFVDYAQSELNMTRSEAQKLRPRLLAFTQEQVNSWVSPWPRYMSGAIPCSYQNFTFVCESPTQIDQATVITKIVYDLPQNSVELTGQTQKGQFVTNPYVANIVVNGTYIETDIKPSGAISVSFIEQDGRYYALLLDNILARSMFHRMFYLQAAGLDSYVTLTDETRLVTDERVLVYSRIS